MKIADFYNIKNIKYLKINKKIAFSAFSCVGAVFPSVSLESFAAGSSWAGSEFYPRVIK